MFNFQFLCLQPCRVTCQLWRNIIQVKYFVIYLIPTTVQTWWTKWYFKVKCCLCCWTLPSTSMTVMSFCLCLLMFTERKVAFSAGLIDSDSTSILGPFNGETSLVFSNVVSNIGQAYSPYSGSDPSHLHSVNVHSTGSITVSIQVNQKTLWWLEVLEKIQW